jgi:hypothetical protein
MRLDGVRRQVTEAREALARAAAHAQAGEIDPAYRAALGSRNLLFHAERGLAAAHGQPLPEMPVVGVPGGGRDDHGAALAALDRALALTDDGQMGGPLGEAHAAYGRWLGWLRDELGRELAAHGPPKPSSAG